MVTWLEAASFSLDEPFEVTMTTLFDSAVTLTVRALETEPDRLELHGSIEMSDWHTVVSSGAFHHDLEPGEINGDGSTVDVVLVLRDPLPGRFENVQAFVDDLFGDERSPLHRSEAWLLASATCDIEIPDEPDATASVGYRTRWAAPFV